MRGPETPPGPDGRERLHAETGGEWRAWLMANHVHGPGVWVVSWRAGVGRPRMSYDEMVEEALCFGWIDSKGLKLDDDRTMLWFSPRRSGSGWSRPNKLRVERLEADGRMTDAGRRVIDAAKADGTWSKLDDVEDGVVPDDLAKAFEDLPGSREQWDAFPRSARRGILAWIVGAKRPETRASRVRETAEGAQRGERAGPGST